MRPVHHKLAKTIAFSGIVGLGLGSAQAASAGPAAGAGLVRSEVTVPCSTSDLDDVLASTSDGEVVVLAKRCTYWLDSALPDPSTDLTILGREDTFRRTADSPSFTILTVDAPVSLSITGVNFVNGGGGLAYDGGAIYNEGGADIRIQDSNFRDNSSGRFGGAIWNQDGRLTVAAVNFIDNTNGYGWGGASYGAGGISDNGGTINLSGDAIIGNQPDNCEPADTIPGCSG